jgi:hypothetical protein
MSQPKMDKVEVVQARVSMADAAAMLVGKMVVEVESNNDNLILKFEDGARVIMWQGRIEVLGRWLC